MKQKERQNTHELLTEPYIVCQNPDPRHHADFADLTVAPNGDVVLLVRKCGAWAYDATFKFGRALTFFETQAEMIVLRSADEGRTFVPGDHLFTGLAYDPMLCALSDGRLMAGMVVGEAGSRQNRTRMRGVFHRHLPQLDTVITVRGVGIWFSEDNGHTWTEGPLAALPEWENVYNLRKAFQLADGTIIMPVTVGYPWRSRYVGLLRSWDEGRTWSDPSFVAEDPAGRAHYAAGAGYWQPGMNVLPSGEMVCICVLDQAAAGQQQPPAGSASLPGYVPKEVLPRMYRVQSIDSGFTWTTPQDTGLGGDFPSLIVLPGGRLLLTHIQRRLDASAVLAHISDDGVTWQQAAVIRESPDYQFYQPNTVALPDGTLLTVFMASPPDQVRVVEAVRWQLK